MRVDLLAALSAHLRTVAPETFDLGVWSCGTTACAIGHAVNVPLIAASGFSIQPSGLSFVGMPIPVFEGFRGWEAVQECFELSGTQAAHCFDSACYSDTATASDVADRLDCFILEAV